MDFLLTKERDEQAAKRLLTKAIGRHGVPETSTIDGSEANAAAMRSYTKEHGTAIGIRQVKYLNNVVEQDHRAGKRVTWPMLGCKSFEAAQSTLVGLELRHMLKQQQMMREEGVPSLTAADQFYALASSALPQTGLTHPNRLHTKTCDTTAMSPWGHHEA